MQRNKFLTNGDLNACEIPDLSHVRSARRIRLAAAMEILREQPEAAPIGRLASSRHLCFGRPDGPLRKRRATRSFRGRPPANPQMETATKKRGPASTSLSPEMSQAVAWCVKGRARSTREVAKHEREGQGSNGGNRHSCSEISF